MAKLEELVKAKDCEIKRLNMIVKNGYEGNVNPSPRSLTRMVDILL